MSLKFYRIVYLLAEYVARAALITARPAGLRKKSLLRLRLFQGTTGRVARVLGLELTIKGRADLLKMLHPFVVLGNHSSYLDMVVLGSIYPCIFVSSVERRDDGALGVLSKSAGTIFVDRINKSRLPDDIRQLALHLDAGLPLCLYLEGTTSNGREILPFKSSLLKAIETKDAEILPICIRYTHANGEPLKGEKIDQIAWYGEMDFFPHFQRLIALGSIQAELTVLEPIRTHGKLDRKEIARCAQSAISAAFHAT